MRYFPLRRFLGVVLLGAAGLPIWSQTVPLAPHFASPRAELEAGINLTKKGKFRQAIPLLEAARPKVQDVFAAGFDLALCYAAIGKNQQALGILNELPEAPALSSRAEVENLRAQVEIGLGNLSAAEAAFDRAAALEPRHLPLYLFLADACLRRHHYRLGLRVVNAGLAQFPQSARLHYQRANLEEDTNQPLAAARDWRTAEQLSPDSVIAAMAQAQASVATASFPAALAAARRGLQKHPDSVLLLAIFGQAALRSGARPGEDLFAEAEKNLKRAVAFEPGNAAAQLALGHLEMIAGKTMAAIRHLEAARTAAPDDPAVYARLAAAYRRMGMRSQAQAALARLAQINRARTGSYRSPSGSHAGYEGAAHP